MITVALSGCDIDILVTYKNPENELELLVVHGNGPNLMGRDWLKILQIHWSHIHQITQPPEKWHNIVHRHPEVFHEELGRVNQVKARIHVDPQAQP